ncbi:FHA domain-containing protein [Dankookia rubra]|uniref:FHA domain-containing protein n=1 Tax=Dankookia rubra TaxID=1442381 RepID=A0A4V3AA87_9PROT|nr:trypsin-like peptidase domain-containing protein [Dankookia rubra]TDH62155.1 FHA domain-containing protein [Dankookia rubra]
MSTRILIKHQTGSKSNQIEQFPLETTSELTLGRDPTCSIAYDAQRDDAVSRRHAVIRITQGDRPSFRIADLGSSNGTLVNGTPIKGETDLLPDDLVNLGQIGPSFIFDAQPRPPHLVARTRVVSDSPPGTTRIADPIPTTPMAATAVIPPSPLNTATPSLTASPTRSGVGRDTVQRMLTEERQATGRKWLYVVGGLLAATAAGGGGLYWRMSTDRQQIEAQARASQELHTAALQRQRETLSEEAATNERKLRTQIGLSPSDIVQRYGNATVYIAMSWRLVDRQTGRLIYHKNYTRPGSADATRPAYVELANGKIVRWLTMDDSSPNRPIGHPAVGSGFVVDPSGLAITNKHVAAAWTVGYEDFDPQGLATGWLFKAQDGRTAQARDFSPSSRAADARTVAPWTPGEGGLVFDPNAPIPISNGMERPFEGRNETLSVRFPDNPTSISAQLVSFSAEADVALIRVNSPEQLTTVQLAEDDSVTLGGAITVLGYPGDSVKTFAAISTIERGQLQRTIGEVASPTVIAGFISHLSAVTEQRGSVTVIAPFGDVYQLTAPAGRGSSGGPVFDANGKAIGILTYGTLRETTTLAVPIRYARKMLRVQQKN